MKVNIHPSWHSVLKEEFEKPYFLDLVGFVKAEYKKGDIYPPGHLIFNAFDKCTFENVKVVILGQDPYHGKGQANGLSFSVNDGITIPPSLRNIYKELNTDIGKEIPASGNLESWAKQGVLMLNATLSVKANIPGSHQNKGWEIFTDTVVHILSSQKFNLVFLLWGNYAGKKGSVIDKTKHLVLTAAHPSPFSAYQGFFGCRHFSKTNEYLKTHGKEIINW